MKPSKLEADNNHNNKECGSFEKKSQICIPSVAYMGIIDEWYTIFQKIKIPHGLILPVGLMSQTFELSFPAFTLARF